MFTPSRIKMANQQKVNLGRLLYKRLSREMKITASPKEKLYDTPAFQYIANQFREHQVTSQKLCKGQNEVMMVGQTYLCMLESLRKSEEIAQMYKTTERSVEDSANLVGLKLPTVDH